VAGSAWEGEHARLGATTLLSRDVGKTYSDSYGKGTGEGIGVGATTGHFLWIEYVNIDGEYGRGNRGS